MEQSIASLNSAFGIAGTAEFFSGEGELPMLRISNASATALISLYGGQLLSLIDTASGRDLLFLSECAYYRPGKAIKGGIPICWPWFGDDPDQQGRPAHGFARTSLWQPTAIQPIGESSTRVTLQLQDSQQSRQLWPHRFVLDLEFVIGDGLTLTLTSRNTDHSPMRVTQALHSYFAVADIRHTRVLGLDGIQYLDKVRGFVPQQQAGPVLFSEEVDRIYQQVNQPLQIDDGAASRLIAIASSGSTTAVVWNPWEALSRSSADLSDDAYRRFVCVETANAAAEVITIAPGESHVLAARIATSH